MPAVRRHPLVSFFVLTYVVAWAFVPFGSFGAFAPLVAALVVAPLAHGREGLVELGRRVVRGASAGTGTRSPSPCPWACGAD